MYNTIQQMFLEDARKHLAGIEACLKNIKESGDQFDIESANGFFQAVQFIKASASLLKLFNIRDLAHAIEDSLDIIRNGDRSPTTEAVEIISNAYIRLGEMIEDAANSNKMDMSKHVERLMQLVSECLPADKKADLKTRREFTFPDGRSAFTLSEYDYRQALNGGNSLYILEYDLISDIQNKGLTPLDIIKFLEQSGRVLDCCADFADREDPASHSSDRQPFHVLFASILERDIASSLLRIDERCIQLIEDSAAPKKESIFKGVKLSVPRAADADEVDALEAEWNATLARQKRHEVGPEQKPEPGADPKK